jgi:hypothetical protein
VAQLIPGLVRIGAEVEGADAVAQLAAELQRGGGAIEALPLRLAGIVELVEGRAGIKSSCLSCA